MKFLGPPSSGSNANVTASRNRFGQYYRNRSIPVQPESVAQVAVRDQFGNGARAWKTLTQGQRDAWNTYGASTPVTDSLGTTIYWTGFNWFVACYTRASQYGQTPPVAPPASPAPTPFVFTDIDLDLGSDFKLNTESAHASTIVVGIYATPPYNVGVTYLGDFRLITTIGFEPEDEYIDFKTGYETRFGVPAVGQLISVRPSIYVGGLLLPKGQFEGTVHA